MIIQETFYVPDEIAASVLGGECYSSGCAFRYATGPHKGCIAAICEKVNVADGKTARIILQNGMQVIKSHPGIATILLIGTGVTGAVIAVRKREPAVFKEFKETLQEYLKAVNEEAVSLEIVERMSDALQNAKMHRKYKKHKLQLTAEEVEILVCTLRNYTIRLAENAGVEVEPDSCNDSDAIINMEQCLSIQKEALAKTA